MMRPLFVTTSLVHGGAERHSITVMNRLAERGHDCHAIYVKNDPSQLGRIRLGSEGTVHCLDATRYLDYGALNEAVRIVDAIRPTVIVAANSYALMYATLAMRRSARRVPLMVTYHSTRMLGIKERIKMLTDLLFIRAADCLVFVSENQHLYWQRRGMSAQRVEVIANGVDPEQFIPPRETGESRRIRTAFGYAEDDYVIGIVAVLRPEKNHLQLLSAIAALRQLGIPAKAMLIGDGPMRASIEARAAALGIANHVAITGYQEDVRHYVTACEVIALCSVTEALSLAAIEAMAMGKPVVLSDVGGAREIVLPGYNGYLFPVGNTDELIQRLTRLADREHAHQLGANARHVAMTQFSELGMVDRYERTLRELCQLATAGTTADEPPARSLKWPIARFNSQPRRKPS